MKNVREARARELLKGLDLDDRFDEVLTKLTPCFTVGARSTEDHPVGGSRVGGDPDLPDSAEWPVHDETHLTFVCQIDLSELEDEWVLDTPSTGWLYFFVGRDEPAWQVRHRVIHFDGERSALKRRPPPSGTAAINPEERAFSPLSLTFEPTFVTTAEHEEELDLEEFTLEDLYAGFTQIWGLPVNWANNPNKTAHLVTSGMESILYRTHESAKQMARRSKNAKESGDPARIEAAEIAEKQLAEYRRNEAFHQIEMQKWRVLFLLGSERKANMTWWDAGLLQFLIHEDHLRGGDFSQTYCVVAST